MDGWICSVLLFRCVILPQPGAELLMLPTKITVLRSIDGWRGSEIGSSSVEWNKYRMCGEPYLTSPHRTAPHQRLPCLQTETFLYCTHTDHALFSMHFFSQMEFYRFKYSWDGRTTAKDQEQQQDGDGRLHFLPSKVQCTFVIAR